MKVGGRLGVLADSLHLRPSTFFGRFSVITFDTEEEA